MKMPKPTEADLSMFREVFADHSATEVKPMFGACLVCSAANMVLSTDLFYGLRMNKAQARHTLTTAGWTAPEIDMATRVLRANASRLAPAVLDVIGEFAATREGTSERAAWDRLVGRLQGDAAQVEALIGLLAL
jgi:hypothetical protein